MNSLTLDDTLIDRCRSGGVPRSVPTYRCCSTTGETILSQIHEMVQAERILTDEPQVQLDTYNPMIPDPGTLSATLLLELTDDDQLREWLPNSSGSRPMCCSSSVTTWCDVWSTRPTGSSWRAKT